MNDKSFTSSMRGPGTIRLLSFLTLFVIGTDTFLVAPMLPLLRTITHVNIVQSGWLVSAYALGYAISALVGGPLSDRADRRIILLVGLAGFVVFTAACAATWDFWSLFIARLLAGAAAAFVTPQIWAAIPVLVSPSQIIKTMGAATAGLSIAQVAGIPIGSLLSTLDWRWPFLAISGAAMILLIVLAILFPRVRPAGAPHGHLFSPYRSVASSRPLVLSLVAYFIFQTGNFTGLSFIATWLAEDFHATQITISITMMIIGCGNAIGSLFGAPLIQRLGPARSLMTGLICLGGCYVACSVAPALAVAVGILTCAMLVGGFVFPVLMNQLQAQTDVARGTVSSLSNTAMYLGTTIAGAVGGILIASFPGYTGISGFITVTFAVALVVYMTSGALKTSRVDHKKREKPTHKIQSKYRH
ncbi:MAG: MFS transporter [Propionibacteriaceae bacterium]|nr:MFS transporter [Propionibacteriaceae bacterium]